jgi:hypothetical protein
MELTMSGIVSGSEQTADLALVDGAKAVDLVDIADETRDRAVQAETLKESATETVHESVEQAQWMMVEEASIAIVGAEAELEMVGIADKVSERWEDEKERRAEIYVICRPGRAMNKSGVAEELVAVVLHQEASVVT